MRALVTGATGFIGNSLVLELRRRGWDVVCMVRRPVEPTDAAIQCIPGDLLQPSAIQFDDAGSVDILFHFGAQLPGQNVSAEQCQAANCTATVRLLECADRLGIRSFVYASSLPVIGKPERLPITEDHGTKPTNPYHQSKLCGEMACENERRTAGRRISSLRITSPYGAGMACTVLARFVERTVKSEALHWLGSGSRAQNFVHVSDIVNAALLAAETQASGVYNVGGAETTTMRELAELVSRLAGNATPPSSTGAVDPEEGVRWDVDLTRAGNGLGYRPQVSLEKGLEEYIAWVKSKADAPRWWRA